MPPPLAGLRLPSSFFTRMELEAGTPTGTPDDDDDDDDDDYDDDED